MRKYHSKVPRWQTLVADKRALIATWTGAVDVRRVAPECKEDEFPLGTRAYIRLCENPGVCRANPASKEKVIHASCVVISPNCEVCHGSRDSLARSLGYRCGMPVCERTRSARCTASECKDASGCKDDTQLRGLLLGRVHRKMRRWRASRSSRCWASASAWCSERRIKSRSSAAAGSRQVFARVSLQ